MIDELTEDEIEIIDTAIRRLDEISYPSAQHFYAARTAKEALERLKPKRVDLDGDLKCPKCGYYLTAVKDLSRVNYCFYCGQRVYLDIDWRNEE